MGIDFADPARSVNGQIVRHIHLVTIGTHRHCKGARSNRNAGVYDLLLQIDHRHAPSMILAVPIITGKLRHEGVSTVGRNRHPDRLAADGNPTNARVCRQIHQGQFLRSLRGDADKAIARDQRQHTRFVSHRNLHRFRGDLPVP